MTERHVEWDRLNDWLDGRLTPEGAAAVRLHLAECAGCRASADALRGLSADARQLPREAQPPAGLWGEIASSIAAGAGQGAARATVPDPALREQTGGRSAIRGWRAVVLSPRVLAAAAVLLVAVSSMTTTLVLRRGMARVPASLAGGGVVRDTAPSGAGESALVPASFAVVEARYLQNVAELEKLFAAQRASLSPTTVAVIQRSLATIDAAIVEARTALISDPANAVIAEMLGASYRQKVELLKRAAEYSPAS